MTQTNVGSPHAPRWFLCLEWRRLISVFMLDCTKWWNDTKKKKRCHLFSITKLVWSSAFLNWSEDIEIPAWHMWHCSSIKYCVIKQSVNCCMSKSLRYVKKKIIIIISGCSHLPGIFLFFFLSGFCFFFRLALAVKSTSKTFGQIKAPPAEHRRRVRTSLHPQVAGLALLGTTWERTEKEIDNRTKREEKGQYQKVNKSVNPIGKVNIPIIQSTRQQQWVFLWTSDNSSITSFPSLLNSLHV